MQMTSKASASNDVDKALIALLSERRRKLDLCVQRHGKLGGLSGRWEYSFRISPDGKTTGVKVRAKSSSHKEFETCLKDKIKRWSFPKAYGGIKVTKQPYIVN